ncbi:M56 family metallopeptidase, partial [Singulisphaera rosea]
SRRLGVKGPVRLVVTSRPIGPAAFGLLRHAILLPEPLLSVMPRRQVELVLAHELIHIRRGDVFAGKLQLASQLIWWFNPLIWWASQQASRERERCCDQEVLSGVDCKPVIYARTLLSVLELKGRLWTLASLPGVRSMEVTALRLRSIMRSADAAPRHTPRINQFVFMMGFALLVPGTALTPSARSSATDEACRTSSTSAIDHNSGQDSMPANKEACSL